MISKPAYAGKMDFFDKLRGCHNWQPHIFV